jgi:hypothetical protein
MRIQQITTITPIQLLTPAKAGINALKQSKDSAADFLKAERDRKNKQKLLYILKLLSRV